VVVLEHIGGLLWCIDNEYIWLPSSPI